MKEEDDLVRVALPPRWLEWAVEIQFLAQAGITYTKDSYDLERFERLRDIAAEIMSARSGLDMDTVRGLFCNETGFQTPKMDTLGCHFQGRQHSSGQGNGVRPVVPAGRLGGCEPVRAGKYG